ncbi:MAG: hypothetical protein WBB28_05835 [Crinalium sp.]
MTRRSGQRPFAEVERVLFRTYVNCQIEISHPRQLYQELDLTQEQLAIIAGCSITTMERSARERQSPRSFSPSLSRRCSTKTDCYPDALDSGWTAANDGTLHGTVLKSACTTSRETESQTHQTLVLHRH